MCLVPLRYRVMKHTVHTIHTIVIQMHYGVMRLISVSKMSCSATTLHLYCQHLKHSGSSYIAKGKTCLLSRNTTASIPKHAGVLCHRSSTIQWVYVSLTNIKAYEIFQIYYIPVFGLPLNLL